MDEVLAFASLEMLDTEEVIQRAMEKDDRAIVHASGRLQFELSK